MRFELQVGNGVDIGRNRPTHLVKRDRNPYLQFILRALAGVRLPVRTGDLVDDGFNSCHTHRL